MKTLLASIVATIGLTWMGWISLGSVKAYGLEDKLSDIINRLGKIESLLMNGKRRRR